jgi:hypothetical protein
VTLDDGRVLLFTEVAATLDPYWIKYQEREAGGAPEEGYVRSQELTEALRALMEGARTSAS